MSSNASSSAGEVMQDVAHAAEEFVEKMNPTTEEEQEGERNETEGGEADREKLLEERKKKLEQLRQKMAGLHHPTGTIPAG